MTIKTNATDRKTLAQELSRLIGEPHRYLGVPSCAYQVGPYTIHKDGSMEAESFDAIRDFLTENGYVSPDSLPASETPPTSDSTAGFGDSMEISIPAAGMTPTQLKNLIFALYSRQDVINRMTDSACLRISEALVERLKNTQPESAEDLTILLDECRATGDLAGFDFRGGKVFMTFPFDEHTPERWTAYASLLQRIYDFAVKAVRVYPDRIELDDQNEKYQAHAFLQRLEYRGGDFKAERKILTGHLSGYCAFGSKEKMQAHKDRYSALRQETRAEQHVEVTVEVNSND